MEMFPSLYVVSVTTGSDEAVLLSSDELLLSEESDAEEAVAEEASDAEEEDELSEVFEEAVTVPPETAVVLTVDAWLLTTA